MKVWAYKLGSHQPGAIKSSGSEWECEESEERAKCQGEPWGHGEGPTESDTRQSAERGILRGDRAMAGAPRETGERPSWGPLGAGEHQLCDMNREAERENEAVGSVGLSNKEAAGDLDAVSYEGSRGFEPRLH